MTKPKLWIWMAAAMVLSACSKSGPDTGTFSETQHYLEETGKVSSALDADSVNRIPAMLRRQDSTELTDEVARIGRYRYTLSKLNATNVDPKAVRLEQAVETTLEAYRSLCLDTAELFREVKEADAKQSEPGLFSKSIGMGIQASQDDTMAVLDALLAATDDMDTSPSGAGVALGPILRSVRTDRSKLKSVIEAQQAQTHPVTAPSEQP